VAPPAGTLQVTQPSLPADFDAAAFERIAKMIFIRLQAANDKADVNDLRAFTTPELFSSLRLDLQDRGSAAQQTDVVTLDAELLRSVLRSIKELQAGMASDMLGTIDVRFQQVADQLHREGQGQAESMLKVAEVLGQKIDRLSIRVDEGVGNDLQIVVDRMSDAIRAMSGVRRDIA